MPTIMLPRASLKIALIASVFLVGGAVAAAAAGKTKFWNITGDTVVKLELAPAGTTNWGPDQCKNDQDDSVDDDERLPVKDVATGSYDVRLGFKDGKTCTVKAVAVTEGKIFSIEKNQLKDCSGP